MQAQRWLIYLTGWEARCSGRAMDRAQELELIERHLQGAGAKRLPPRRAAQTSAHTEAEQQRQRRWRYDYRARKAQRANRAP